MLTIRVLGGLVIEHEGQPITDFVSRKAPAILVYLAFAGRPLAREVLADLLWPEATRTQALGNLRVVLTNLRQLFDPYLIITRQTVQVCDTWLDAQELDTQLSALANGKALSQTLITQLNDVLTLYHGDLLEGFYIDSAEFEDWMMLERERLRLLVINGLNILVSWCGELRDYTTGITQAGRLLQLDPLREETHRQLMELYVQAGNRRAALVQYESCRSILQAELGIGPEPETTALVERIRAGEIKELTPDPILLPQHNLLPEATSFVGREDEVSSLSEQLTLPDCRLLTLVGPGGIGKTRLALKVAEQKLGRFEDGVFFIALASLHTPDAVVSAIASAVRFRFYEVEQSFEDQFLHYLHNKELLLILDNFEHQMAQVSLVEMVLTTAPRIKFLVTSREALNLDWEWRYEVRGLDIPKTARALNQSSASRLFLERARRLQPQFSLADHADGILRICQLVNGMPLGIELAASWLKTLPCEAIADEIQNSIDFLATTLRNVPERHRSMRAVFDQSWRMLSDEERDVLARLAVFRGGFEREAAQQIAGANLIMLTGLVDKSLLQCDQRYSVHELLRQYVTEQMPSQAMYAAYSAYYMEFFIAREADIKGRRQWAAIDELTIEFENIRAAWRWYVEQQDISMINRALDSLFVFSMFRHFGTTEELLREVREREDLLRDVRDQLEPPEHEQIWGRIAARHEVLRLPNPEVRATIEHCLTIARQYEDRNEIAFCLMALGYDAMSDGDYDRTIHFFEKSLAVYRELNDLFYVAQLMSNLGLICGLAGQYERAVELLEDSQCLQRKIGDEIGATVSLNKKRIVQHLMRTDYR